MISQGGDVQQPLKGSMDRSYYASCLKTLPYVPNSHGRTFSILWGSVTLAPLMSLHHDDPFERVQPPATPHCYPNHNSFCTAITCMYMEGNQGTGEGRGGQ